MPINRTPSYGAAYQRWKAQTPYAGSEMNPLFRVYGADRSMDLSFLGRRAEEMQRERANRQTMTDQQLIDSLLNAGQNSPYGRWKAQSRFAGGGADPSVYVYDPNQPVDPSMFAIPPVDRSRPEDWEGVKAQPLSSGGTPLPSVMEDQFQSWFVAKKKREGHDLSTSLDVPDPRGLWLAQAIDTEPSGKNTISLIEGILSKNKDKNFVKRILNPTAYPKIELPNGYSATHLMAWAESGDKFVVYPTIQFDEKTNELIQYSGKDAYLRAMQSGDFIEFDTPEEADWFSKEYKRVWAK
jgi:hypothetical protein